METQTQTVATFMDDGQPGREARGRAIAKRGGIAPIGDKWIVPSQSSEGSYVVDLAADGAAVCNCPDAQLRATKCKHAHSVEFFLLYQDNGDGTVSETVAVRRTYRQNWPAYNAAQTTEREHVEKLLRALCDGIVDPPPAPTGRKRIPLRDLVYAAILKVYGCTSGRRGQTDVRRCRDSGLLGKAPSYNTIFRAFENPALTPILSVLVEESAAPLRDLERQFAPDSTGFSTSYYERHFDVKHNGYVARRPFVKLHAMIGTNTNVITSAIVSDGGDAPMLPPLLNATVANGFTVAEVSADKGYLSKDNAQKIVDAGAACYIPFKENSTGDGPALWRELFAFFMLKRPEFLAHYHRRSNAETAFHMVKAKFGPAVKSKLPVAQTNEVLAKCICHNLAVLVSCIYESGLEPRFWTAAAHGTVQ